MMIVKTVMRKIINTIKSLEAWAKEEKKPVVAKRNYEESGPSEIQSIWGYLNFKENTQAAHLTTTIGFEEWVEMPEIRRRIKEIFGIEYKNERSLYPYVKTLVDCGLLESTDAGGKRKWRKKALVLKLKQESVLKKAETEKEATKSN